jgi:hypothetical protein
VGVGGLDLELLERAAQEAAVQEEPEQVDLAGRRERQVTAGRRHVVVEGAVRAFTGAVHVAADGLAVGRQAGQQIAQLLGLGEAEVGVVDRNLDTLDAGVGPGRDERRIDGGEAHRSLEAGQGETGDRRGLLEVAGELEAENLGSAEGGR